MCESYVAEKDWVFLLQYWNAPVTGLRDFKVRSKLLTFFLLANAEIW